MYNVFRGLQMFRLSCKPTTADGSRLLRRGYERRRFASPAVVRAAACAVATCLVFAAGAPPAFAGWIDGKASQNTYSDNSWTGSTYTEKATAQYVGYSTPAFGVYKVGQIYYVHAVVRALGDPNTTYYGVDVQLHLPANTYLAVSSTYPIYCFLYNPNGASFTSGSQGWGCPSGASSGDWPYPSSGWWRFDPTSAPSPYPPGLWDMSQGQAVEIQVPVFSTVPLEGLSDDNSFLAGAITIDPYSSLCNCGRTDGPPSVWNFNGVPSTGPYEPVTVDPNPPTIGYSSPSSTSITASTAHTTGYLFDHFATGTAYTDIGATTSYGTSHADAIDGAYDAYYVDQDWTNLSGSTTYHWRLRFVPTGGSPACSPAGSAVCGADQTFTTAPGPPATGGGPTPGGGGTTSGGGGTTPGGGGTTPGSGGTPTGTGGGTNTPPHNPMPPAPTIATSASVQGQAALSGNGVSLVLSCTAPSGHICPLSAHLLATEKLVGTKLAGIARHRRAHNKQVVVGSLGVSLTGGQTKKIVLPLNALGRTLLAKFGRLPITLTVALNRAGSPSSVVTTQHLVFKAHTRHHH